MLRILIFTCISLAFTLPALARQIRELPLNKGWEFRQVGQEDWNPAEVPGTVHTDLFRNGLIPDPFYGSNADSLLWIENEDWEYRMRFQLPPKYLRYQHMEVVFEGLDTFIEIYINGEKALQGGNMFRRYKIDAKRYLKEGDNDIRVVFLSPIRRTAPNRMQYTYNLTAENDDSDEKASPFVRKAPYHFGWDWAPRLVTAGIWKRVYLRLWEDMRIDRVKTKVGQLESKVATVDGHLWVSVDQPDSSWGVLKIDVDGQELAADSFLLTGSNVKVPFNVQIKDPELWWPHGYGDQRLYQFEFKTYQNGQKRDSSLVNIGLRSVELVQEKDEYGTSFYFKVNERPIYARGGNYVPTDMFLPRGREQEAYVLKEMKAAHFNMVRVWAGGGYASDEFYDFCDENGILVWQDLAFANTMYPFGRAFRGRIRIELMQQVTRLRHHPSLALWCGNNEMEVAWQNWGWATKMGVNQEDSLKIWNNYKEVFQKFIPGLIRRQDGTRPYISSSPLSNWGPQGDFDAGNMHYWGVWHGEDDFAEFHNNVPRFMTEYGWQSFPTWKTLAPYAAEGTGSDKKYEESEFLNTRQKSNRDNNFVLQKILARYGKPAHVEGFLALSQLVQAEALEIAIRAHREARPRNMGSLYWQVNDAWPGASWSTIDYSGRAKAAYYAAKEMYYKRALQVDLTTDSLRTQLYNDEDWKEGRIRWTLYDLKGRTVWMREKKVRLGFEGPQVTLSWALEEELEKINSKKTVLLVEWIEVGEETVSKVYHALPPAELKLKTPDFKHRFYKKGKQNYLEIQAKNFIKALEVQFNDVVVPLSDNYMDFVPGQTRTIAIDAPRLVPEYLESKVEFRSLSDWMK